MNEETEEGLQRRFITLEDGGITASEARAEGEEKPKYNVAGTPVLYGRVTKLYSSDYTEIYEIIDPGAATEALKNAEQVLLWNHDSSRPMASRKNGTLEVREDGAGLHITADVSGSSWGREGHEAVKSGLVTAMSFAFTLKREGYTIEHTGRDKKDVYTRKIHKFDRIIDFSPVTYPAYKETEISARSAEEIVQEIEREKRGATHAKIKSLLTEFSEVT